MFCYWKLPKKGAILHTLSHGFALTGSLCSLRLLLERISETVRSKGNDRNIISASQVYRKPRSSVSPVLGITARFKEPPPYRALSTWKPGSFRPEWGAKAPMFTWFWSFSIGKRKACQYKLKHKHRCLSRMKTQIVSYELKRLANAYKSPRTGDIFMSCPTGFSNAPFLCALTKGHFKSFLPNTAFSCS